MESAVDLCSDRSGKHGVNIRALGCSACAAQLQLLEGNWALKAKSRTWRKEKVWVVGEMLEWKVVGERTGRHYNRQATRPKLYLT